MDDMVAYTPIAVGSYWRWIGPIGKYYGLIGSNGCSRVFYAVVDDFGKLVEVKP